jgi:hypothetical protein
MQTQTQDAKWFILEELKHLPAHLRKWCADHGLFAEIPERWAEGEPIVIGNKLRTREIALVSPETLDTTAKLFGIWGMRLGNNLMGFWPSEGWKVFGSLGWKKIDGFGIYFGRALRKEFGIDADAEGTGTN